MQREIEIPHNFHPREYQLEWLAAPQRFKIAVLNRRAGKSKTALNQQVARAMTKQGIYYYFLPTYRQAKQVMWDSLVNEHIPPEIIDKRNESELAIHYKNGSIQRFAGCEDIDKHRGINPVDVVFDEYAAYPNGDIWTAIIQPVLRENKGTASFIFTPSGLNHAYHLLEEAKTQPEQWYVMVKNVEETGSHTPEELEEARKNTPQALFNQEYMCDFLEDAGAVFRGVDDCVYGECTNKFDPRCSYLFGIDLAKHTDYTVIIGVNKVTHRVEYFDRFNQIDWNLQKARIGDILRKFGNATANVDATGLGDPIVEELQNHGLNVNGVKFTNQSKRDLITNLSLKIEQQKIKIPDIDRLIYELRAFRYETLPSGAVRYSAPEGSDEHDDCVIALALATWELGERLSVKVNPLYNRGNKPYQFL